MRLTRLPESLIALEEAEFADPIDVHFAGSLGEVAGEARPEVLMALALASRQTRAGHVCVPLVDFAGKSATADDASPRWPELSPWLEALRSSALVGTGTERKPVVLDGSGRLYLHRYYEHERRLSESIRERTAEGRLDGSRQNVASALARLFETRPDDPLDDQQLAVLLALVQRFVVISGGPGTGKTTTVARLLALLVELALEAGHLPPRILLLAPTGKAAGRLVESIRGAKARLKTAPEVLAALPEEARTIHRALGVRRGTSGYWHDASRPLIADVVLVDEASMVDLALMRHLFEAVPPGARLILLGDRHQLASVEAGSVLSELCLAAQPSAAAQRSPAAQPSGAAQRSPAAPAPGEGSGARRRGFGKDVCQAVAEVAGKEVPLASGSSTLLTDHVVELTKSYRFDATSPIGRLASAVRDGDVDAVFRALESGGEVAWFDESQAHELSRELGAAVVRGFAPVFDARHAAEALEKLGRFRLLCAHRRGYAGVEHLNHQVRQKLGREGLVSERLEFFPGRPVLITQNDYAVHLFNGDVGLVWAEGGSMKVHFEGAPGGGGTASTRPISPARLPAHETAFAMSVHKSQGSEHEEVVVVLPEADSPLLTRELLYTAITRARRRVQLFGTRAALEVALRRSVARASGLADALRASPTGGGPEEAAGAP